MAPTHVSELGGNYCPKCNRRYHDNTPNMVACDNEDGHGGLVWFHYNCVKRGWSGGENDPLDLWYCLECQKSGFQCTKPSNQLVQVPPRSQYTPPASTTPTVVDTDMMDIDVDDTQTALTPADEDIERMILDNAFKKEEWESIGQFRPAPADCTFFVDAMRHSQALERCGNRVSRLQNLHLTRIIAFQDLDANFSFSDTRIQTRWKLAHINVALTKARESGRPLKMVSGYWQAFLKACREAKETPYIFDAREYYIQIWKASRPSDDFPELTTADIRYMRGWFKKTLVTLDNLKSTIAALPDAQRKLRAIEADKQALTVLLGYHAEEDRSSGHKLPKSRLARKQDNEMDNLTTRIAGLWPELERMEILEQLSAFGIGNQSPFCELSSA